VSISLSFIVTCPFTEQPSHCCCAPYAVDSSVTALPVEKTAGGAKAVKEDNENGNISVHHSCDPIANWVKVQVNCQIGEVAVPLFSKLRNYCSDDIICRNKQKICQRFLNFTFSTSIVQE
jgi:hypothetical protein